MDNQKLEALTKDVLELVRNRLILNLRYMDPALTFGEQKPYCGSIASDGQKIFFDPAFILTTYHEAPNNLARTYLHMVMHCVFLHPFRTGSSSGLLNDADRRLWDLACDIAAGSVILELDLSCTRTDEDAQRMDAVRKIRRECGFVTAEKIYAALRKGSLSPAKTDKDLAKLEELFRADDHSVWYEADPAPQPAEAGDPQSVTLLDDAASAAQWKTIAEKIEMEIETFAKVKGRYASSLVQNLRAVSRERYDYDDFLRKFSSMSETVRVSEDEFDYIYYNYGLQHYQNMPLIEPLEYREDSRIRDFVIAVDTSGSVAGDEVQAFIQKTYSILKARESLGSKINVHIVQCDAKVQSDTVITQPSDLDKYMEDMEIRGLGGTDFRPVFDYVDGLIEEGEFSDLKGLIYFTDGLGTYPAQKPPYKTAFVFLESGYNIPEVPVWAMKVILQPEELTEETS